MYKYGAEWTGTDISENQINEAKELANEAGMNIDFYTCDAKDVNVNNASLDVITACQCIWYLNHGITAPKFAKFLKDNGSFLILYMGWLPFEDEAVLALVNKMWLQLGIFAIIFAVGAVILLMSVHILFWIDILKKNRWENVETNKHRLTNENA